MWNYERGILGKIQTYWEWYKWWDYGVEAEIEIKIGGLDMQGAKGLKYLIREQEYKSRSISQLLVAY